MAVDELDIVCAIPPRRRERLRGLWGAESAFSNAGREYRETLEEEELAFVEELDRRYRRAMGAFFAWPAEPAARRRAADGRRNQRVSGTDAKN